MTTTGRRVWCWECGLELTEKNTWGPPEIWHGEDIVEYCPRCGIKFNIESITAMTPSQLYNRALDVVAETIGQLRHDKPL